MNKLTIIKCGDAAYIDSREVAEIIGKRHDNLLRDIGNYLDVIDKITDLNFEGCNFFVESCYTDSKGRSRLCYLITKAGCEAIANKLTGEKGILFTFAYVAKFNEMEAAEREAAIQANARPRLSEFNSAVRNVLSGMSYYGTNPSRVMNFLQSVYKPLGIEIQNDTDDLDYYSATVIAQCLGINSASGRPHRHAVSAIISKLDNWANHSIVIPYGLVGASMRYDFTVVSKVIDWIAENNKPSLIPHLDFDYHVFYDRKKIKIFDRNVIDLDDDDEDYSDDYTAEELDAMCGKYGDCDDCPGFLTCCEVD